MGRRRALRRRIVVVTLLLLSVAFLTLYFRESSNGPVHQAQEKGLRLVAPLQEGTARVVKPFRDAWNWVGDLFSAKSQNRQLRTEVEQLRQQVAEQLTIAQENEQLRGLAAMRGNPIYPSGYHFRTARVIARSTTAWNATVTIDAGSSQGVKLYDAVVNHQGLVGRVSAVTADASQVTLVTDPDSYVDAMVVPGGTSGLLAGSVTGDLTLQYVDKSARVETGQIVVTSGMTGSIFVRGIPIGRVSEVGQQDVELYQGISVTPYVDFHSLDLVLVVEP